MKENTFLGACQNSPFNEIILATTICGEDDFLFIRVLTHLHYK